MRDEYVRSVCGATIWRSMRSVWNSKECAPQANIGFSLTYPCSTRSLMTLFRVDVASQPRPPPLGISHNTPAGKASEMTWFLQIRSNSET